MTARPAALVCLVTDRRRLAPDARTAAMEIAALERLLDDAAAAAVDLIHIRERDLPARDLAALVGRVVARTRGVPVRVLVNDRGDIALASNADGVHLRHDAPAAPRVRALRPSWTIGRSIHTGDTVADAAVDYFVFGPVFPTVSKPDAPAAGLTGLTVVARQSSSPVLAIGGIDPARAAACVRHGAGGVAAIGLFLPADAAAGGLGPARAVRELRDAMAAAHDTVW